MIEICELLEGEEQETCEFIVRVFYRDIAPTYSKDGIDRFLGMLSPDGLREMSRGDGSFVILAGERHGILGMLSVIRENHIALLFVDPEYQNKGIGKKLIDEAIRMCVHSNPEISAMTVSSTPNAKSFYVAVGFHATDGEVDEDGMLYTLMWKPCVD